MLTDHKICMYYRLWPNTNFKAWPENQNLSGFHRNPMFESSWEDCNFYVQARSFLGFTFKFFLSRSTEWKNEKWKCKSWKNLAKALVKQVHQMSENQSCPKSGCSGTQILDTKSPNLGNLATSLDHLFYEKMFYSKCLKS